MCVRNAMTRILTGFALVLALSTASPAWARTSVAVDVGIFYDDLAPYGDWFEVREHGWVWAPSVDDDWRPYAFGHWVWTDDYGWLWESDEDFGWAVYHYGRWYWDPLYGWVWVPGYEWGPAWVSFRYGGGYVGWAPLPPRARWVVGRGLRFEGAGIDALIEPRAYTFCEERAFFTTAVHRHALPPSRNAAIIGVTRNVTDYDVVGARVVGRGPSVGRLEARLGRRAPRARVVEVDSARAARGRRDQRDAVTIFRPEVRPRADATPPRGRAMGRREARERREAVERQEERERREEVDRQQVERRKDAEERRRIEQRRATEESERRRVEKRRREAQEREARMQVRRQNEEMERARKDLERRQAAERKEMEKRHKRKNPAEPQGLGRRHEARSGRGKEPEGKRPQEKPDRKGRKDHRR